MNLNLGNTNTVREVSRGDIIVMKCLLDKDYRVHYLVIEDSPNKNFTLLQMKGNKLMSSIRANCTQDIIPTLKRTFRQLELVEVIYADEYEVVRKN